MDVFHLFSDLFLDILFTRSYPKSVFPFFLMIINIYGKSANFYIDFCVLFSWKWLSDLKIFCWNVGCFKWRTCHFQIVIIWLLCFLFVSFHVFLWTYCSKNLSTPLNKNNKSGHICLIDNFRGNIFTFPQFKVVLTICML